MAKFVFQLEAVLKQRLAAEREKQLVVAGLERERAEIEGAIRALQLDLTQEKQELHDQLTSERVRGPEGGTPIDLRGVRFQAGAALRLIVLAQRAVLRLAGVHKKLDAARLALLEAATRRKAVETLKERRHAEWREEQKRRENAEADELSVMLAARTEELA
jgi:flagellar export protein FliJ